MKLFSIHHNLDRIEKLMVAERQKMLQYACYRLGNIDDAEDVVQDVFVKLYQRLHGGNVEIRNMTVYLYRTLANACVSNLRDNRHTTIVSIDNQPDPIAPETDDFEQEYRRINSLLNIIPDEQAEVIRLRFYGDKSFQEIADILNIPLTTAKSRFTYGMEKIKRGMRASLSV